MNDPNFATPIKAVTLQIKRGEGRPMSDLACELKREPGDPPNPDSCRPVALPNG